MQTLLKPFIARSESTRVYSSPMRLSNDSTSGDSTRVGSVKSSKRPDNDVNVSIGLIGLGYE